MHYGQVKAAVIKEKRKEHKNEKPRTASLIAFALVCALAVAAHADDDKKVKEQQEIRKMAQDTLQRLYKADPRRRQRSKTQPDTRSSATWA